VERNGTHQPAQEEADPRNGSKTPTKTQGSRNRTQDSQHPANGTWSRTNKPCKKNNRCRCVPTTDTKGRKETKRKRTKRGEKLARASLQDHMLTGTTPRTQVARCTKIIDANTDDAKYVINVKQIAKVRDAAGRDEVLERATTTNPVLTMERCFERCSSSWDSETVSRPRTSKKGCAWGECWRTSTNERAKRRAERRADGTFPSYTAWIGTSTRSKSRCRPRSIRASP